jgi:hypothetical protein
VTGCCDESEVFEMAGYLAALDTPMTVEVVDGEVVVLGPNAISVALTPRAAEESGRRLLEAARRAAVSEAPKQA